MNPALGGLLRGAKGLEHLVRDSDHDANPRPGEALQDAGVSVGELHSANVVGSEKALHDLRRRQRV